MKLGPAHVAPACFQAEIGDAKWLPLSDYYELTRAASAKQNVPENFNAFVARNVLAAAEAGTPLADLGLAALVRDSPQVCCFLFFLFVYLSYHTTHTTTAERRVEKSFLSFGPGFGRAG